MHLFFRKLLSALLAIMLLFSFAAAEEQLADTVSEGLDYSFQQLLWDELLGLWKDNIQPEPTDAILETGTAVNRKMKSMAFDSADTLPTEYDENLNIRSIRMAESLPDNFKVSADNTVSTASSPNPIYIFFDSADEAGVMYFYTEGDQIFMNPDSSDLFRGCRSLSDITGLQTWNTQNVISFRNLFAGVSGITNLNSLPGWNTSNVTDMQGMFFHMTRLTDITALAGWNTSNVTSMRGMFYCATALSDISALANWDTSSVISIDYIFAGDSLVSLHGLENWDTRCLRSMSGAFAQNRYLANAKPVFTWNTSNVIDISGLFMYDTSLTSINLSQWDTGNVTDVSDLFSHDSSLISIDLTGWDMSKVTNMSCMFQVGESHAGNGELIKISGLGSWDVSNVTDMTCMFYGAAQMTTYDIADWDVSKVESFNHMFTDNYSLCYLDLSRWNVQSVKTMNNMFDDNFMLITIGDVSHWNTVNLIDAGGWMNGARSFIGNNGILDLSGWNTINLKSTKEMFREIKVHTIDLTGWTFDSITNKSWEGAGKGIYYETTTGMSVMFQDTSLLKTVYVSQSGLESFHAAEEREIDMTDMWLDSSISGFTVK